MSKRIFAVGFNRRGTSIKSIPFSSERTLLEADIVVYKPTLGSSYPKKDYSKELQHWHSELKAVLEAGKVVIVFLVKPKRESYRALPIRFEHQVRKGREIVLASDFSYFASYWQEFADYSSYEVTIQGEFSDVLLKTKSGDHIVGASTRIGQGVLILLPPVHYSKERFMRSIKGSEDGDAVFGKKLEYHLVELAKKAGEAANDTVPPDWTRQSKYRLREENDIEKEIAAKVEEIRSLEEQKWRLEQRLHKAKGLKQLLYEQGHQLEQAILEALQLLGFEAKPHQDGESEFDAVFVSPEGRFLGEAEGKDRRQINIDKLSQLERNLQEDFAREGVTEYAKGVLFGNAHRLVVPEDRPSTFTQKCVKGAERSNIALVRTPDLFEAARYLKENDDPQYARQCREAICQSEGKIVKFPDVPTTRT
jgi:hypothetical protein